MASAQLTGNKQKGQVLGNLTCETTVLSGTVKKHGEVKTTDAILQTELILQPTDSAPHGLQASVDSTPQGTVRN